MFRPGDFRILSCLFCSFVLFVLIMAPFGRQMRERPVYERLGHVPQPEVLKAISVDQAQLVGAALVMKVMIYFGGLSDEVMNRQKILPDYPAMYRVINGAVKLDPYNMDAYYFAQAVLVWDVRKVDLANTLLDYGMKYRTWDWYLPFFAGFNNAYFLKDYAKAAEYYRRAGELSGSDLYKSLAGRYLQESGRTGLAIVYLSTLVKSEKNEAIRKSYQIRLKAYRVVQGIEQARDRFRADRGRLPASLEELIGARYLAATPVDPYGGIFSLTPDGEVRTTSKFAFGGSKKSEEQSP